MELLCVAASSPWLNYEHRLVQRVARLSVWKFVLETAIETLAVAILPWRAWLGLRGYGQCLSVQQATHQRNATRRDTGQQEPPWYGTVCPVVWEDGGGDPASYLI